MDKKNLNLEKKMNNAYNPTVEMVKKIQIYSDFEQGFPGTNLCQVALLDGRKIQKAVPGQDIYVLIKAIAEEKIDYMPSQNANEIFLDPQDFHFFHSVYSEFSYSQFNVTVRSANEILSSLFAINALSKNIGLDI